MYKTALQQVFRAAHFPVEKYGPSHWKVTPAIIGELRVLPYVERWKRALREEWFHVKLEDHSVFVFYDAHEGPSYSFLQSPISAESFRTYLARMGLEYTRENRTRYSDDYSMLLDTAGLKPHLTPIRFDVDKNSYKAGVHPLAHIHIGLDNEIRLAVRRHMSPLSFVLFVMRHMYPDCWDRLLARSIQFRLDKSIRQGLRLVSDDYWSDIDGLELHLM